MLWDLHRKNFILALIIGAMGFILLAQWIYNIAHRITFPFPIEYLEDATFFQALRIYEGLPIYTDPNSGYAAMIYTPGYFYILAGLFKIFGPSIALARFMSLACTLGIMAMLYKISSERLRFPFTLVPLCVYLSLPYAHFAGYQDLGRVDTLMVFLIFAVLFVMRHNNAGAVRIFGGVVLITLAYYVKQPALGYLYFLYIYLYIRFKRTGLYAIFLSFGILVGIFFIIDAITHGWFYFYTWELPINHTFDWSVIWAVFTGGEVHATYIRSIIYLGLATIIFIVLRLYTLGRERVNIFEATLPGALITTIGPFLKEGGFFQDFIPLYTHLCFLLPYALSLPIHSRNIGAAKIPTKQSTVATSVILFLVMIHCVYAITPIEDFRPKADNVRLGWEFVHKIEDIDGEVFMPALGYYGRLAGKEPGYLGVSLVDLLSLNIYPTPLVRDLKSGRYAAICVPYYFEAEKYMTTIKYSPIPTYLIDSPTHNYRLCRTIELPPFEVYWRDEGVPQ